MPGVPSTPCQLQPQRASRELFTLALGNYRQPPHQLPGPLALSSSCDHPYGWQTTQLQIWALPTPLLRTTGQDTTCQEGKGVKALGREESATKVAGQVSYGQAGGRPWGTCPPPHPAGNSLLSPPSPILAAGRLLRPVSLSWEVARAQSLRRAPAVAKKMRKGGEKGRKKKKPSTNTGNQG
jgi:hypothetical protein